MATLTSILRVLSDFGDAAGWLIAAGVLVAYGRRILRENEKAHTTIGENIKENRRQIDENRREITSRLDRVLEILANR